MARKNPLGKIKDLTKGAASLGLNVAGQATKTATSLTSGAVSTLASGRKSGDEPGSSATTAEPSPEQTPVEQAPAAKAATEEPPAEKATAKKAPATRPADEKPAAKKPAAKKPAAKKATVKPAAKKATAKPAAKEAPVKKAAGTKAPAGSGDAQPVNVTEELGLDPAPVEPQGATAESPADAPLTTIDAAADPTHVEATPADLAKAVAKKAPTRKSAAKKAPATKRATAQKTTAQKTTAQRTGPGAKLPPRKKAGSTDQADRQDT